LSGSLIPGPLLVYTIAESLRKGWKTGFYVILGHAAVEVVILLLLLAGVKALMTSELFVRAVSLLGGGFMAYTAYTLHKSKWVLDWRNERLGYGAVAGGVLFTAFNPSFPLWWATAGARLLLEGMEEAGLTGALLVVAGHWAADLGWYVTVSAFTANGRERVIGRYADAIRNVLALLLLLIGLYFVWTGFK